MKSFLPTSFCQFSEIDSSGVFSSPNPQFSHVFSINSFILNGSRNLVMSSPMGISRKLATNFLSWKEVSFLNPECLAAIKIRNIDLLLMMIQ